MTTGTAMGPDTIVYVEAESRDLAMIKEAVDYAVENGRHLRVTMDGDTFKIKAAELSWSPPISSHRPNGGY